jgi:hypothetical protein
MSLMDWFLLYSVVVSTAALILSLAAAARQVREERRHERKREDDRRNFKRNVPRPWVPGCKCGQRGGICPVRGPART